jgi:hypothetical protein
MKAVAIPFPFLTNNSASLQDPLRFIAGIVRASRSIASHAGTTVTNALAFGGS